MKFKVIITKILYSYRAIFQMAKFQKSEIKNENLGFFVKYIFPVKLDFFFQIFAYSTYIFKKKLFL